MTVQVVTYLRTTHHLQSTLGHDADATAKSLRLVLSYSNNIYVRSYAAQYAETLLYTWFDARLTI